MARKSNVVSGNISITGIDKMAEALQEHDRKVKRNILGQMMYAEGEGVAWAKQNAPWTDRTGNARSGLFGKVTVEDGGNAFNLMFAGSVPYQIWLETRFSGKYAIIQPTIDHVGNLLMQRLEASLKQMGASV